MSPSVATIFLHIRVPTPQPCTVYMAQRRRLQSLSQSHLQIFAGTMPHCAKTDIKCRNRHQHYVVCCVGSISYAMNHNLCDVVPSTLVASFDVSYVSVSKAWPKPRPVGITAATATLSK